MNAPVTSSALESPLHAAIEFDQEQLARCFDREPFGFTHTLSQLDLFRTPALHRLAEKMSNAPKDYLVAAGASAAGTQFFSVPMVPKNAVEALENLDTTPCRILIKRAENHDADFRDLIHTLFEQVKEAVPGLRREKILRLESGLLVTSAATITPFHYDEEIGFFSQIEGDKIYHVYSPTVVQEEELDRFSIYGGSILAPLELNGRDPSCEYVYHLKAGKGFHQPKCAPHWVETRNSRSVSYTFVFETEHTRAEGRTRAFNHYMRRAGLKPAPLGSKPGIDQFKSEVMAGVIPARKAAVSAVRKLRGR